MKEGKKARFYICFLFLDLGLPDMDGMEVLHKIREWSEVPIIIVSARDQDKEKAAALDDGADDYLTKPFSATELMARIRVALRHYYRMNHSESEERPDDTVYVNGDLKLDNGAHIAYKDDKEIHLTPLEYQLCFYLCRIRERYLPTIRFYGRYGEKDTGKIHRYFVL